MTGPKLPNRFPGDAPNCDTRLPALALEYRNQNQLITEGDFSAYNVSVWRLENKKGIEFAVAHNRTIGELEKAYGSSSTKVGLHAEVLVAERVFKRLDVLRGETRVTQIFTERIPCSECHEFLRGIPQVKSVPRYFYLSYSDREWQRRQAGDRWGLFLMDCYRLRTV